MLWDISYQVYYISSDLHIMGYDMFHGRYHILCEILYQDTTYNMAAKVEQRADTKATWGIPHDRQELVGVCFEQSKEKWMSNINGSLYISGCTYVLGKNLWYVWIETIAINFRVSLFILSVSF